jgi:peptidyl serine alpha-galactosyltransferase
MMKETRRRIPSSSKGGGDYYANKRSLFKVGGGCFAVVLLALAILIVSLNVSFLTKSFQEQQSQSQALLLLGENSENASPNDKPRQQSISSGMKIPRQPPPSPPSSSSGKTKGQQEAQSQSQSQAKPSNKIPETNSNEEHHLIFSTSCDSKQDWQGYLFFYQVMVIGQPGHVTRIVSGCSKSEEQLVRQQFETFIRPMSDRFHIHFTPQYGIVPGKSWQLTKYWNKPFGILHFLEHVLGFPDNAKEHEDSIIILVDPDMLLLQPIVNEFSNFPMETWTPFFQGQSSSETFRTKVSHGKPISQEYGFGAQWLRAVAKNLTYVVGFDSPVHNVNMKDASTYYPAGPPYIMTGRDWFSAATLWAEFLPRVFDVSPQFMSEMYGYCLAMAHLEMPIQLAKGFMVSNAENSLDLEGWYFLKNADPQEVCTNPFTMENRPLVFHFCQRYSIGDYFFSKYKYPASDLIRSCDSKLIELPPQDCVTRFNYSHYGDGSVKKWNPNAQRDTYSLLQNSFAIYTMLSAFNNAGKYYRNNHCEGQVASFDESWNFFAWEKEKERKRKPAR